MRWALLLLGLCLAACDTSPHRRALAGPTPDEADEAKEKDLQGPEPKNAEALVEQYLAARENLRHVNVKKYMAQLYVGHMSRTWYRFQCNALWWGWRAKVGAKGAVNGKGTVELETTVQGKTELRKAEVRTTWFYFKDGLCYGNIPPHPPDHVHAPSGK